MGGSFSKSDSSGSSQNLGSDVWGAQAPFLKGLYGLGQSMQNAQGMQAQDQGMGMAQDVYGELGNQVNFGIDPRISQYNQQVGQDFARNVMPQIQGQAALAGGLGNSRNQIAQGIAAGDAQRNMQNFAGQLYGQNQDRALQASGLRSQLAQGFGDMAWGNLQNYSGILGGPVMKDLGGSSKSSSSSFGGGFSGYS